MPATSVHRFVQRRLNGEAMYRRPENQLDFCDRLADLIDDQSEWSQATFGRDSERGPIGALKHLEKEAVEAQKAVPFPSDLREELADCLLLLLDATRRGHFNLDDIVRAAQAKMVVNKARTWPKPTSDEPVEHVR